MRKNYPIDECRKVVSYCPPSVLAEMIHEWTEAEYISLAQVAVDEAVGNCGMEMLAEFYCTASNPQEWLQGLRNAGLIFP